MNRDRLSKRPESAILPPPRRVEAEPDTSTPEGTKGRFRAFGSEVVSRVQRGIMGEEQREE